MIFKCVFQESELSALHTTLPADEFCIIKFPGEQICYGVMNVELHSRFMDILSGETLEHLEYPDEKELNIAAKVKTAEFIGNKDLLKFKL